MGTPPDITVPELRAAIGRILDAVEDDLGDELRLPVDYYWNVMPEDAHGMVRGNYDEPRPTLGQVSDDAASLKEFLAQPTDEHVMVQHGSAHFRGLLLAIEYVLSNPELVRDLTPEQ